MEKIKPAMGYEPRTLRELTIDGGLRDRRFFRDRRQRSTRPFSRYTFVGRRERIRRLADRKTNLYVDRYGHGLLIPLFLILLLSILDAYFTILLIERGAQEINPLMNFLIEQGYMRFFLVKYLLTALAVLVFCVCKNHLITKISIAFIISFYLIVFANHLLGVFYHPLL
jgi:hypothetical protein